jgi:dienelactone hydrolase
MGFGENRNGRKVVASRGLRLYWLLLLLTAGGLIWLGAYPSSLLAAGDPGQPGPCAVASQTVTVGGSLTTDIYYPSGDGCGGGIGAPYPAVAFAHGFSMFGLSDGRADNAGNGEHLASWGYVAAVPDLPDDHDERTGNLGEVVSYLEAQATTDGSFLQGKVDIDRLAAAGHSIGGATALSLAARDSRVKAVVALDPVYHTGGPGQPADPIWDLDAEGPNIVVPTGILGAPGSDCNSDADYAEIYPVVGATHKAEFLVVGGSHCDFADPGSQFCGFTCGNPDAARTRLSQQYMTAWFNYYLHYDTAFYEYLYGAEADSDITSGLIERQADTAPRNAGATSQEGAVLLSWTLYDHPMVAGYNAYRRLAAETYPDVPQISAGPTDSHLDEGLVGGETYFYMLASRDAAGNEHQLSSEVSAAAEGGPGPEPSPPPVLEERLYVPLVVR